MNVFFDNCTSPRMARTLAGYLGDNSRVVHARDIELHDKPDIEWIRFLTQSNEDWLIVTGDGRLRKNRVEREAYRRAGLRGVVLAPAYQKTPVGRCCGILVAKWDDLVDFTGRIEPPYLVEVSINLQPRFKLLPL